MNTTQTTKIEGARDDDDSRYPTQYSEPWVGQDGRVWRSETVWCFPGWRTFLAVKVNGGRWQGW
jgi:hypothetical protein